MKYKFERSIKKIEYKDKVIIANLKNGKWIKIHKQIYEIILFLESHTYLEVIDALHDDDKQYIKDIIKKMVDLHILVRENEPMYGQKTVLFEITNRCNLYCKHCCNNAGIDTDFELSYDEVKEILNFLVSKEPQSIILSGGEPMIRNDFCDIIKYLKEIYNGKISLMTNGTFITEENIHELIKDFDEINISLDGVNEETCSAVRGKGVFSKVVNNVKLLKKNNFNRITLSMVIGDKNFNQMKEFIKLNEELGTTPLIRSFVSEGRGAESKQLYYEGNAYDNIEQYLSDDILNIKQAKKLSACSCGAGKEKILIDYKGNIYPCQWFRTPEYCMGNVFEKQTLFINKQEILEKVDRYFPQTFEKCKDCKVNLFCWPCPGELKEISKDEEQLEQTCKQVKPILMKHIWGEDAI